MLRGNLATRPFYNEKALALVLWAVAVVVVVATAYNIARVAELSRRDTRLATQAARDEARTAELRASARRVRASVDAKAIERASIEARLANDLIDRRIFSWTDLFNRFEATLPDDVRITSVRPHVDSKGNVALAITVSARTREDVNQFIENLEKTAAFARILSRSERPNEKGEFEADLETLYVPSHAIAPKVGGDAGTDRSQP